MQTLPCSVAACLALAPLLAAQSPEATLVAKGSYWKYHDQGTDLGTSWRAPSYNDTGWGIGAAQLGYGDFDEKTWVSWGLNANDKYVTTYFRRAFQVAEPKQFRVLKLRGVFDDGAVVYLNGVEVWRYNMPTGTVGYRTLASQAIGGALEDVFLQTTAKPATLVKGTNVLAVEVHQAATTSSDLSFDLEVVGSDGSTSVVRGPYLQMGTPAGVRVRWRTDVPTDSVVWHGTSRTNMVRTVVSTTTGLDHEAAITGLSADTRYYYAIGTTQGILRGGDAEHWFRTSPPVGRGKPTRVWVIGDSGTGDMFAAAVRDGYKQFTGSRHTDVWLMLGDNAYNIGRDIEYQRAVFETYPDLLRRTVLWPALGNHDGVSASSANESGVYYTIFSLPRNGEAGGVPSHTEAYYSFDYGDIHFVCLDSYDSDRTQNGPMMKWLANDLAATKAKWKIAFAHHPPYTKGSHDSDNDLDSSGRMRDIRSVAVPILEKGGVDLFLAGHSHSYERSFLLDGHYSKSSTLKPDMILDPGDGCPQGDGEYRKASGPDQGTVYAVAGSSGKVSGGMLNHPAMYVSLNVLGSLVLDFAGDTMNVTFLDVTSGKRDTFTIEKGAGRNFRRDVARLSLTAGGAQNLALDAGSAYAGSLYVIAGSLGAEPGFWLGTVHVPLNVDPWFFFSLTDHTVFSQTIGLLDAAGKANAAVRMPANSPSALLGLAVQHAAIVFDSGGRAVLASNWERLRFTR